MLSMTQCCEVTKSHRVNAGREKYSAQSEFEFFGCDLQPGCSGFIRVEYSDGDPVRGHQLLIHGGNGFGQRIGGDEGGFHPDIVRIVSTAAYRLKLALPSR